MYIKIIQPNKDGNKIYQNSGSVNQLIAYLRNDYVLGEEDESVFFNHENDKIYDHEVEVRIDESSKKLKPSEEKFYSIIVSPAEEELLHIDNKDGKLKEYVRQVMNNYAANFQLKNRINLRSRDLVWYAAIHKDREIKNLDLKSGRLLSVKEAQRVNTLRRSSNPNDQIEISKIINRAEERESKKYQPAQFIAGNKKPGFHKHAHIIVSRLDAKQENVLNPRSRQSTFHIKKFQEKSARDFQQMFDYKHETISKGFYQKYSTEEHNYFHKKIENTTDQINRHLGEEKIDVGRLKEIGNECSYSRAFFINLTKLKYRFTKGNFSHDPYFFVKHGRDQKQEEYLGKLDDSKTQNQEAILASGNEHGVPTYSKGRSEGMTASQMLKALGSIRGGSIAIKETLVLDDERKQMKKSKEKGRGEDQNEIS
ncbi:hypothetical protein OKW21_006639 [Catalinimonas alkaloidigena]|uniref:DUF5712 family protein n=1 Tax=Catalinimonas alkaloidigena TaxID=1075417 RepID=UPI0024070277|nr:DUF5712 family protein [Catalinimonas alkaloidigena]MDF9801330.1 hypothetical protein [Catalinimonas alkaloidigena]